MIRKIIICAVIALILVPAGVLAAGFGGQNAGTAAAGQGQCLHDGQNCADRTGALGSGNQSQYRYGAQQAAGQGQCLHDGQNCADRTGTLGSGNQSQYRYGAQQNTETGTFGSQHGQGTHGQKHARSMSRIADGTCTGCKNVPVTQT